MLFASVILLVPTTAMGATLPLAVRARVGGETENLLAGTGVLYAANTVGAVAGSLLAPLVLMPWLGVRGGALAATLASVAAALVALAARTAPEHEPAAASPSEGESAAAPLRAAITLGAFVTGAVALGFEVLWTRSLTTQIGSSVHAFAAVLALVLGGIALGAALATLAPRLGLSAARACGVATLLAPALGVALFALEDWLPVRLARLGQLGTLSYAASLRELLSVGVWVIVPAAICFGAALPLAIRVVGQARSARAAAARPVARVYVANTLGAILGTALTGLVLVPALGLHASAVALAACGVGAGALVLWLAAEGRWRARGAAAALVALAGATLALAPGPQIFAGAVHERAVRLRGQEDGMRTVSGLRPLYYAEGPEASVAVESEGLVRAFYVAGRPEASNGPRDVRTQYLLGHLPALLAGGAERSLVVGLGSGMTAGALAHHGEVTIAELNRAVPGATRLFGDLNHDVLDRARLRIEDGRVVLAEPGAPYDVVTTDPIHPYIAGSALLYTSEHFELCRRRLAPGGMVSLWLPLAAMGAGELRAIVGSFVDVFADAELYLLSGANGLLVGGGGPRDAQTRLERLRRGWDDAVRGDMLRALIETPEELAALWVADGAALASFSDGWRRNRDDDPWIELTLPGLKYENTVPANLSDLLALRDRLAAQAPLALVQAKILASYVGIRQRRHREALALLQSVAAEGLPRTLEVRVIERETSAHLATDDLDAGRHDAAGERAQAEAAHPEATLRSLYTAAEVLSKLRRWQPFDAVAARILREYPQQPEGFLLRAQSELAAGRYDEAARTLEAGLHIDRYESYTWFSLSLLGRVHLAQGRFDDGLDALHRSLERRPAQPSAHALLQAPRAKLSRQARAQLASRYAS